MLFFDLIQEGNMGLAKAVENLIIAKVLNFQLMRHGGLDKQLLVLLIRLVLLEFRYTWLKRSINLIVLKKI